MRQTDIVPDWYNIIPDWYTIVPANSQNTETVLEILSRKMK